MAPLRKFAQRTIDVPAVLFGVLAPRLTINDMLARSYRRLFGTHTLADLQTGPEFVFDATSLQSGDLWRFSTKTEGDWVDQDRPAAVHQCVELGGRVGDRDVLASGSGVLLYRFQLGEDIGEIAVARRSAIGLVQIDLVQRRVQDRQGDAHAPLPASALR